MMVAGVTGVAAALLAAGLVLLGVALRSLRRRQKLTGTAAGLSGALSLALAALLGTLSVSVQGYHALTHEEPVLTVQTRPIGPQRFIADVAFPGGARERFSIAGDQLYVDARILKWKAWANLLGLHTAYQLDRIGGRYTDIEDERRAARSLFSLARKSPVDAFELRRRHAWLAPLVDAAYGSATFIAAEHPATYEVRVSTSGLLVRRVNAGRSPAARTAGLRPAS